MNWRIHIYLLTFVCSGMAIAQDVKDERESFITREEVPSEILSVLDSFMSDAQNIKYVEEHDGTHDSYEVKFLLNRKKYSVEFSKDSELEDVEVDIHPSSIPKKTKSKIDETLKTFQHHKITKAQKQFSSDIYSDNKVIEVAIANGTEVKVCYELEISLKEDGHWEDVEMLFDIEGSLLAKKRIIERESDYLLFR